jgi:hypothetical protein
MQEAPESREALDLIVRIWGMANGRAFFQSAHARHLGREGAELSGIEHPLAAEDVIGVQYGDKKARFRVIRVKDHGLPQRIQADVQLLSGQECPWRELVKEGADKPAWKNPASPSGNKRTFPRLKVRFPLELRDERGGGAAMQTNTADASGRGCYVETLVPLPLGTKLTVIFWIESEKISTSGVIRASDPGVGMGIEFIGLGEQARERLQAHLQTMTDDFAGKGNSA